jgi:hypothetical protein
MNSDLWEAYAVVGNEVIRHICIINLGLSGLPARQKSAMKSLLTAPHPLLR